MAGVEGAKSLCFSLSETSAKEVAGGGVWVFLTSKGLFSSRATEQPVQSQRPRVHKEEHPVSWDDSVIAEISL